MKKCTDLVNGEKQKCVFGHGNDFRGIKAYKAIRKLAESKQLDNDVLSNLAELYYLTIISTSLARSMTLNRIPDEEGLVFEEGCLKCKSCGHTTCS